MTSLLRSTHDLLLVNAAFLLDFPLTAGYKYMHSQPLLVLAQGRIEEWIREWRLSSAESRDLYLETAALLRTNKVGNRVPIVKLNFS